MSPTITETAEAFSRHRFEDVFPYILADAEWTHVGGQQFRGKADIVKACEASAGDLANVKTSFSRFKIITTDDCVVIDSRAEYVEDVLVGCPVRYSARAEAGTLHEMA